VTFHSWSHRGSATPYVEHALGDERGRELALALGVPFVEAWDWPFGLLGRELRTLGIPSAELELYGLGRHTDAGLRHGLHAAKAAAASLGILAPRTTLPTIEVQRRTLVATATGRAVHLAELGSEVAEGTPVAESRGLDGRTLETFTSPVDGWLAAHMTYGIVHPGDSVVVIFERLSG
jgi:predicted deacylase